MRKRLGITGKLVVSSVGIFATLWLAMTLYSVHQLQQLLYEQNVRRTEAQILNWIEANISQITITRDPGSLDRLVRELRGRRNHQSAESNPGFGRPPLLRSGYSR